MMIVEYHTSSKGVRDSEHYKTNKVTRKIMSLNYYTFRINYVINGHHIIDSQVHIRMT